MRRKVLFSALLMFLAFFNEVKAAERDIQKRQIKWAEVQTEFYAEGASREFIYFEGAQYLDERNKLPYYHEVISLGSAAVTGVSLKNAIYGSLTQKELALLAEVTIPGEIKLDFSVAYSKKEPKLVVKFLPFRMNASGEIEKILSFDLQIFADPSSYKSEISLKKAYASSSILASGNWYRMGLTTDGVYKISYSFLKDELKMDLSSIDPRNIRIYGNGGGMLPLNNSVYRRDDLTENPILVVGENDGKMDSSDYVLFYGQGPDRWEFDSLSDRYVHIKNIYSDTTYYFISADLGPGKRIADLPLSSATPTHTVNSFDDHAFYENDAVNLIKSGSQWYGEKFDVLSSYNFSFNFPNIDVAEKVFAKVNLAGRAATTNYYNLYGNSSSAAFYASGVQVNCYHCDYASPAIGSLLFDATGPIVNVTIEKSTPSAVAWLNYIEVNARRQMKMSGEQMLFRDSKSAGTGNISSFELNSAVPISIWKVTDIANISNMLTDVSGNIYRFVSSSDSIEQYIAFTNNDFLEPKAFGKVPNQNLHAIGQPDLIIVVPPVFIAYANTLAALHTNQDKMNVVVVTPQQVYNEFSSGAQDVSAIRDFMKMLYDRAADATELPHYLMLFGDGSYDPKRRFTPSANSNYIPCYQSDNSLVPTSSYVSDDFFGLLDDKEGGWTGPDDLLDIGIGRIPVRSAGEAQAVVNKILNYVKTGGEALSENSVFGDWRNTICFIADDEDYNTHISQADQLAGIINKSYKEYNVDKIYLDAYLQESTPGGNRYPGATDAINKRVNSGALIMNYTGHGGEVGLTHERVVEISHINSWSNFNKLPLFVTATCEFSRFDDPERTSAGELVLLNPNGGGIALLTTVRLVYASPNFTLNKNFYNVAFKEVNGEMPRLGDLYQLTKVASGSGINNRNFTLLGDPALLLAYPRHNVITTAFNGEPVDSLVPDTMKALSKISVSGYIADNNGIKLNGFNGIIYPTVYDKSSVINTLSNDGAASPSIPFSLQKNILYKGKVSITNGDFNFTFVVPKDIAYNLGFGRISYYADDGSTDANGYYDNFIIGGSDTAATTDNQGPVVKLYMNDDKFVFGGLTDENPILLAHVSDANGINTVGNGIGHDVTAVLDNNREKIIVLNENYEANLNSYQSGIVKYRFSNLEEGSHSIDFKVWDVYNNSSEQHTEFVVARSAKIALDHVLNYPNPFTSKTQFRFEHNQYEDNLDVQVQIFTVTGKLIKTISRQVQTTGFSSEPIDWDGTDDFGDKIGRGTYIYKLSVRTSNGESADKIEKLVILN